MQQPRLVAIHTGHSWNNLVVSHETHASLDEISKWIVDGDSTSRLKNVSGLNVLFNGPPNTLKDITAILIGKEAGWPVYRVDLSTVISDYIGETEKNLAMVFENSGTAECILFFDDAGELFSKRTVVKNSHDKYAAVESFLNRIDQFNGISIVAANMKNNIDDAFIRRFQVVVNIGTDEKGGRGEKN